MEGLIELVSSVTHQHVDPITEEKIYNDVTEFSKSSDSLSALTTEDRNDILVKVCRPLLLSDNSLSDKWHERIIISSCKLMTELFLVGSSDEMMGTLRDVLENLILFIGNDSSQCSDDQLRQKIKAVDNLSSHPDLLKNEPTLLQMFQSLIVRVSSPDWHRISVRRWLFKILPKVLEADQGFLIVLRENKSTKSDVHVEWMCAAAGFIFSDKNPNLLSNLSENNFLWKILSEGLTSIDSLVKKKSLYLLKRWTDYIFGSTISDTSAVDSWILTDPRSFASQQKLWNNYFIVLETLDEKQVHIVKQVLGQVQQLLGRVPKQGCLTPATPFHLAWILVLYRLLFKHQNPAIVVWCADHFLKMFTKERFVLGNELFQDFLCGPMLNALNNTKLFEDSAPKDCRIGNSLIEFFAMFSTVEDYQIRSKFWSKFLTSVFEISWGPIPLFYVTRAVALSSISTPDCEMDEKSLENLKNFVTFHMKCQEPMIRGAAQSFLLDAALNWTSKYKNEETQVLIEKLLESADFLASFHGQQRVLIRGTPLWKKSGQWLKAVAGLVQNFDDLMDKILQHCHERQAQAASKIGFTFVLLFDAFHDLEKDEINRSAFIKNILNSLSDRVYRSYSSPISVELKILSAILTAVRTTEPRRGKEFLLTTSFQSTEVTLMQDRKFFHCDSNRSDIGAVILRHLMTIDPAADDSQVDDALLVLQDVCNVDNIRPKLIELTEFVLKTNSSNAIKDKIISTFIIGTFSKDIFNSQFSCNHENVANLKSAVARGSFPVNLMEDCGIVEGIDNREAQRVWGAVAGQFTAVQWKILHACLSSLTAQTGNEPFFFSVFSSAVNWLNVGGLSVLVPMFNCVERSLMLMSPSDIARLTDEIVDFLRQSQRAVFELRKSDAFWSAFQALVSMAFNRSLLTGTEFQEVLMEIAVRIFEESNLVHGMSYVLVNQMVLKVESENFDEKSTWITSSSDLLAFTLVEASLYGPTYKKDQKIVCGINSFIASFGEDLPVNLFEGSDHLVHATVRTSGLKLLFALARREEYFPISAIVSLLNEKCEPMADGRVQRCFENSALHLKLVRVFQMIVLMSVYSIEAQNSEAVYNLLKCGLICLVSENQRPSIRYLGEWSLSILGSSCYQSNVMLEIEAAFQRAIEMRLSAVPAFLGVFTNVALCGFSSKSQNNAAEEMLEKTMKKVIPWTMAHHFGTRLTAQLCFQKLYNAANNLETATSWLSQYRVVSDSLKEALCIGDAKKNAQRIDTDFYLSAFDPVRSLNLENIFYDFPRLSQILASDCIPIELLKNCMSCYETSIPLSHCDTLLSLHRPESKFCFCRNCLPLSDVQKEGLEIFNLDHGDKIQKKITPWKDMMDSEDLQDDRKPANPDLILVASLVDRPPNLGGLCRTCEILGVGQYVIGCSSVLSDKEFQNLSVTAQNWVDILEVRKEDLPKFFATKKKEGYRLIGVEQTQDSARLDKFDFPVKTVLLLGNEKEGIPVELIQELDDCVEIPQSGLVRSLNVHVSGALVVWEYVRQSLVKISTLA